MLKKILILQLHAMHGGWARQDKRQAPTTLNIDKEFSFCPARRKKLPLALM